MKKTISVVLALTMLFALCVPAFAADEYIYKDTVPQTGDTDVVTTFDATTDETYTITYPATVSVAWGDTAAQDAKYTVTSALRIGAKLTVKAEANAGGEMTNSNTSDTLTFTVQNGAAQDYPEVNNGVASSTTVTIADFSGAAVGEYTGTMTYTVTYTAPVTP
ncbi:MAG: hypothetical protein ACI4LB_08585 [Candidatus Fimenecus sp.]